jgi:hypothetical protein
MALPSRALPAGVYRTREEISGFIASHKLDFVASQENTA